MLYLLLKLTGISRYQLSVAIVKDLMSQDLQRQSGQASERLYEFSEHIVHALIVPSSSPYSTSNLHLLIIKQSLEREVQHGVY